MYPQFRQLDAKCPSLDAKIVTKVQNYIDLTFALFDFEVVGRNSKFFGFSYISPNLVIWLA